jgi:hypothetical protein
MSVPATTYLYLVETGRTAKRIHVSLAFASGVLDSKLNWTNNSSMFGYLEAKPSSQSGYDLAVNLKENGSDISLDLVIEAKLLFEDQAFFGSIKNSNDGIQLFSDQEGGYSAYIYKDGQDYTEALYSHLLSYNNWALENGYPQIERRQLPVNTICEAFPQTTSNII